MVEGGHSVWVFCVEIEQKYCYGKINKAILILIISISIQRGARNQHAVVVG